MTVTERIVKTTICLNMAEISFFQFPEWLCTTVPGV